MPKKRIGKLISDNGVVLIFDGHTINGSSRPSKVCPICGETCRITNAQAWAIRVGKQSGLCLSCAATQRDYERIPVKDGHGYTLIPVETLPAADRILAGPMATKRGYVRKHRLTMARTLGRPLKRNEVVHHRNGIKDDNHPENLRLMPEYEHAATTWAQHAEIARLRAILDKHGISY